MLPISPNPARVSDTIKRKPIVRCLKEIICECTDEFFLYGRSARFLNQTAVVSHAVPMLNTRTIQLYRARYLSSNFHISHSGTLNTLLRVG
jgi:hypothetical protein